MERISDEAQTATLLEPYTGSTARISSGTVNYSLLGEPRLGTVLLIAGLSMHRTDWSPELIAGLLEAGYATLAADNRDAGVSDLGAENDESYGLADMAADVRELIELLGVGPVHAVGMSMGGMIAQHLAMLAPDQVRTLTSVMSTTGARGVGRPQEESKWVFMTPAPTGSREDYIEFALRYHEALSGGQFSDPDRARQTAEIAWTRGINPEGTVRQLTAIRTDGDRTERLGGVTVPTLVVHGDADPLIDISGGLATAAAIPGAAMFTVPGMGHSIPWQRAEAITKRLVGHFSAADAQ